MNPHCLPQTRTQRICQLVPSATARYDLRAFAYTEIEQHGNVDAAIIAMMLHRQTSLLVSREIVMWVVTNLFKKES